MPAPGYLRGYKRKRKKSPKWLVEKIDEHVTLLRHSDRPEEHGESKKRVVVFGGRAFRAFGIDLTDSDRLIYGVDRTTSPPAVILDRVCNHKQSYVKDD